MGVVFTASQFKAANAYEADAKARFGNHFLEFVESDFSKTLFASWFYKRLCSTFGHIAHFDQDGFFGTFFTTAYKKVRFLERTLNRVPVGDPECTYSDVERAIQRVVVDRGYLAVYAAKVLAEVESAERAELARLKAKYEPPA